MSELSSEEINQLRVSMKEYFDSRLAAIEKQIATSNHVLDIRLEGMNEFRQSMQDQANTYLTMKEHNAWREKIESELQALRDFKTTIDAKADQKTVTIGFILSLLAFVTGVIGIIEALGSK